MRKLTGYIGALIIVFALMGSILAGYALNVNGSSSVINEYEKVTDVSGLYSHTQEPSYIDYNPASNYIGYSSETVAYTNTPVNPSTAGMGYFTMKKITDNCTIEITNDKKIIINGIEDSTISTGGVYWRDVFYSTNMRIIANDTDSYYYLSDNYNGWREMQIKNITVNINDGNITVSALDLSNNVINFTIGYNEILIYWPHNDFDYYYNRTLGQYTGTIPAYFSDEWPIYLFGVYNGDYISSNNNKIHDWNSGTDFNHWLFTYTDASNNNKHSDNINYQGSYHVYYPKNVFKPSLGITYTESNRVNNYLMETTYTGGSTQTVTQTLNLSPGMGLTDYWGAGSALGQVPRMWRANSMPYDYNGTSAYIGMPTYTTQSTGGYTDNLRFYNLFDILSYYNISTDKQITIKAYGTADYLLNNGESIGDNNFTKLMSSGFYSSPEYMDNKLYCIYNPDTQTFDYYDKDNAKWQTSDKCYVAFCGNSPRYGPITDYAGTILGYYDFGTRPTPHLDISYETQTGGTTTYHYSDITKGYSIKDTNVTNVVWNNEYYNGNIQILFRANDTIGTYHNDLIVGDNTISIDYTDGGYSITLNSGDPVAVGKWRNIVLNMDLKTGELSVIPVRTFNSYTNVVMDTASIVIGDMVNPAPTNTIEWEPTSNSLMFNVYSTAVFMNTYGVVMVNPQLNITDYFTDLNGFYRMRLYNFSILGSSITVNGVTADVNNNSITIDEQTVQVKDMAITYADGHAYISDSNVNIDLGEIVNYNISMSGAWYFETELLKGFTSQKMVYTWDWGDFILNNTQFCIMYIGIALVALMIARHYCTLSITDYIVLIVSFAIALTVQVVA